MLGQTTRTAIGESQNNRLRAAKVRSADNMIVCKAGITRYGQNDRKAKANGVTRS
jgi:hypothetical protein